MITVIPSVEQSTESEGPLRLWEIAIETINIKSLYLYKNML